VQEVGCSALKLLASFKRYSKLIFHPGEKLYIQFPSERNLGAVGLEEIPLDLIEENPLRITELADAEDIVNSFLARGQLSPIRVRRHPSKVGKYQIIYGSRRFSAAKKLGWKSILAEVVDVSDYEALMMAFSENMDRKNFSDYEKALLLNKIHSISGETYSQIAVLIGRSSAFVSQHVAMLNLFPPDIASEEEKLKVLCALTEKHARVLAQIENPLERWNSAKLTVSANLCVRELQRLVTRSLSKKTNSINGSTGKKAIQQIIYDVISGLNRNDLRPYFEARSLKNFSIFDDFPPFVKMNREAARDHSCAVRLRISRLKMTIDDLEIKILGESAFATMSAIYRISTTENGENLRLRSRATLIFARECKGWKIVHEHWSCIDLTDSKNALFELIPRDFHHSIINRGSIAPLASQRS
jgi:ParB family chromosome partitioning protein